MSGFFEINTKLVAIEREIETVTHNLSDASEAYRLAKADYENDFARYQLEHKMKNPDATQTDVKATATNLSYPKKLDMIRKESAYRRLINDRKGLTERLDALREVSWNTRRESQI